MFGHAPPFPAAISILALNRNPAEVKAMTTGFATITPAQAKREIAQMDKTAKAMIKKGTAKAFLIKHGFIQKNGQLTKRYR